MRWGASTVLSLLKGSRRSHLLAGGSSEVTPGRSASSPPADPVLSVVGVAGVMLEAPSAGSIGESPFQRTIGWVCRRSWSEYPRYPHISHRSLIDQFTGLRVLLTSAHNCTRGIPSVGVSDYADSTGATFPTRRRVLRFVRSSLGLALSGESGVSDHSWSSHSRHTG